MPLMIYKRLSREYIICVFKQLYIGDVLYNVTQIQHLLHIPIGIRNSCNIHDTFMCKCIQAM